MVIVYLSEQEDPSYNILPWWQAVITIEKQAAKDLVIIELLKRQDCYMKLRTLVRKGFKFSIKNRHILVNVPEICDSVDLHKPLGLSELVHPLFGAGSHS